MKDKNSQNCKIDVFWDEKVKAQNFLEHEHNNLHFLLFLGKNTTIVKKFSFLLINCAFTICLEILSIFKGMEFNYSPSFKTLIRFTSNNLKR